MKPASSATDFSYLVEAGVSGSAAANMKLLL
jgi:hypothetical protein